MQHNEFSDGSGLELYDYGANQWRNSDFVNRHKGSYVRGPDYYLEYGDKYVNRFLKETYFNLSADGKIWLVPALVNLQVAIENKLVADPGIEERNEDFTNFAFTSHVDAYVNAGILKLNVLDKVIVGLTPDPADLINDKGLAQVLEVGKRQGEYYKLHPDFALKQMTEGLAIQPFISWFIAKYAVKNGVDINQVGQVVYNMLQMQPQ